MTDKIRVAVADDHPIFRAGLRNLIEAESDLELVGEADNGQSALVMFRDKLPDIAIVDISMPAINGIGLTRRLAEECPNVRVLILTLYEDRSFLKQALAAGAKGYLLKRSAAETLVRAVRIIKSGTIYLDPLLIDDTRSNAAIKTDKATQTNGALGLTDRELSVLRYSARGLTIKEIADRLEIGPKTVETYKSRATEKLGLKTRAEIVRFASTQGWLEDV